MKTRTNINLIRRSKLNSSNFSDLSFVPKLVERAVIVHFVNHCDQNSLLPATQSAYRRHLLPRLPSWTDCVQRYRSCGRQKITRSYHLTQPELSFWYGRPRLPTVSPPAPVLDRRCCDDLVQLQILPGWQNIDIRCWWRSSSSIRTAKYHSAPCWAILSSPHILKTWWNLLLNMESVTICLLMTSSCTLPFPAKR